MSFRLEMLQVARLAPKVLGESADLVTSFMMSRHSDEGGFVDRQNKPDLYYTVFGLEGLLALQEPLSHQQCVEWLRGFGDGASLDFVHLCCLARCHAALRHEALDIQSREGIAARVEQFAAVNGGYHVSRGREWGSAYGCLLAAAAYDDLGISMPRADGLQECMTRLQTRQGAWNNEIGLPLGMAPATAAAMSLYRRMGWDIPAAAVDWLLSCFLPDGGCKAFPGAPIPDLLSTAVALHGLSGLGVDMERLREPCLDFVDSLWSNEGGFHGNWTDSALDCEYTYYGLLALGHLAV